MMTKEEALGIVEKQKEKIAALEAMLKEACGGEKELERIEQKLEFAWAGSLGRWEWDYNTGKVTVNARKKEALGYQTDEIDPTVYEWTEMIHPDDFDPVMDNMRDHLYGKTQAYEAAYRIIAKDGTYKWFYDRGVVTERNDKGAPLKLVGIVFDITESKEAEEKTKRAKKQLEELNAAKDKFFSIIAHDLKNPFNYLLATTEFLYGNIESLEASNVKDYVKELNSSAKQVFSLLENLLQWARAQSGRIKFDPICVNLFEITLSNASLMRRIAEGKNITLTDNVNPEIEVFADYDMVNTVVRNILSNAIKFTEEGGSVKIEARDVGDMVEVVVEDDGKGIPPEEIDSIFNIGEENPSVGTAGEVGTGLGLSLCKDFIEKNRGTIRVESKLGEGSKFIFTLHKK